MLAMRMNVLLAAVLTFGMAGTAQAVDALIDFQAEPYASTPQASNIAGVDHWTGGWARLLKAPDPDPDFAGRPQNAVQVGCNANGQCTNNGFIYRQFQPGEAPVSREFGFTGWPQSATSTTRLYMTISPSTNLGVDGNRLNFGFDGGQYSIYSDQNPGAANNIGGSYDTGSVVWTDVRVVLNDADDSVTMQAREWTSDDSNAWTTVATSSFPGGWGGELITPAIIQIGAENSQWGPAIDDIYATEVPEPATLALFGLGGLLALRRRRA